MGPCRIEEGAVLGIEVETVKRPRDEVPIVGWWADEGAHVVVCQQFRLIDDRCRCDRSREIQEIVRGHLKPLRLQKVRDHSASREGIQCASATHFLEHGGEVWNQPVLGAHVAQSWKQRRSSQCFSPRHEPALMRSVEAGHEIILPHLVECARVPRHVGVHAPHHCRAG